MNLFELSNAAARFRVLEVRQSGPNGGLGGFIIRHGCQFLVGFPIDCLVSRRLIESCLEWWLVLRKAIRAFISVLRTPYTGARGEHKVRSYGVRSAAGSISAYSVQSMRALQRLVFPPSASPSAFSLPLPSFPPPRQARPNPFGQILRRGRHLGQVTAGQLGQPPDTAGRTAENAPLPPHA